MNTSGRQKVLFVCPNETTRRKWNRFITAVRALISFYYHLYTIYFTFAKVQHWGWPPSSKGNMFELKIIKESKFRTNFRFSANVSFFSHFYFVSLFPLFFLFARFLAFIVLANKKKRLNFVNNLKIICLWGAYCIVLSMFISQVKKIQIVE